MSNEIRVLHVISALASGGVQSVVLNYAEAVRPYGVVFDYVVQGKGNPEIEKSVLESGSKIYYLPPMTRSFIKFGLQLKKLLKDHREIKIVHVHFNYLNFIPLGISKTAKVPFRISHSHACRTTNNVIKMAERYVAQKMIKLDANQYWACSVDAYNWLYGCCSLGKNSYILHNAIKIEKFIFSHGNRVAIREQIGLDNTSNCLICVATLSENKNQIFLIRLLSTLPHRFKLLLVGDGKIRPQLIDFAKEVGVDDRVLFLGDRGDVPALLSAADCFVLASKAEGLGLAAVEAEVNGLPCVISDCVPREVAFTEQVWFEPIGEDGIPAWKNRLLQIESENHEHSSPPRDVIASSGYDISVEGRKLAHKYKELLKR